MRALRIDTDGTITELDLKDAEDLATIQEAIGGWVEHHTIHRNATLWLDEDAPSKGVVTNQPVHHMITRAIGVFLNGVPHGPAVITGGENGAVRDLDDDTADLIRRIIAEEPISDEAREV